jgi:uncharacterized membrane protein
MLLENKDTPSLDLFLFALIAGVAFCCTHLLNGWILSSLELSDHINYFYLPSFFRLFNVLVLGLAWGTLGTAIGGMLLFFWFNDSLLLSICNTAISASSAALAVWMMSILQQRKLSITKLRDLFQLALLYAVLNALLHHLMWSELDPKQLIAPNQLAVMVIGDINGAVAGALLLRWIASRTQLIQHLRRRINDDTQT